MSQDKNLAEPTIKLHKRLSEAFEQMRDQIRERAYHIFLERESEEGDAVQDWFEAQSELLRPVELSIKEQKKNVVAECDLKGFSPEEIEIEVEDGVLKVCGCHQESNRADTDEGRSESTSESIYFFQSAILPSAVDLDHSHAKLFKNGKLKVTLPKAAARSTSVWCWKKRFERSPRCH